MKKTILIVTLILSSFVFKSASAQIRLGLNLNLGTQPVWGPVGYDRAEYYYMPDIDAYYNVSSRQYVYMESGRWAFSTSLPYRYRNYDLNSGYKVVINGDARPYMHAANYRTKYAGYRGNHSQQIIRNSGDQRYFENKDHPRHNEWKNDGNRGGNDNNRGRNDRDHHDN